jgi:hypothetical protein
MQRLNTIFIGLLVLQSLTAYAHQQVVVVPMMSDESSAEGPKLLFMTNGEWKGDLGGLQGADDKCNAEARSRGFSGSFQALLAHSNSRSESRSNQYALSYQNPAGDNLRSGYYFLFHFPYLDNPVLPTGSAVVWTGLNVDESSKADHCDLWNSSSVNDSGGVGFADAYDENWYAANTYDCNVARHLYCIEQ